MAVLPAKRWHLEVHAVPPEDQRQRRKDGGDDEKQFHQAVEADVYLCLIRCTQIQHCVIQAVDAVGQNAKIPQRRVRGQLSSIVLQCLGDIRRPIIIALSVHTFLLYLHDGFQIVLLGRIHQCLFQRSDLPLDGFQLQRIIGGVVV